MNPANLRIGALVGLSFSATLQRKATRTEYARLRDFHGEAIADTIIRGAWTFEGWTRGLACLTRVGSPEATVVVHHSDLRTAPIEGEHPWRRGPVTAPALTRTCLLQALLVGPEHGFGLIARVKTTGLELEQGSVYPTLRALARVGLIEMVGPPLPSKRGGHPRSVYRLTPAGEAQARKDRGVLLALASLEPPL